MTVVKYGPLRGLACTVRSRKIVEQSGSMLVPKGAKITTKKLPSGETLVRYVWRAA